ncbi:DUF2975 domain-containing protein [Streptomyces sp. NPDC001401]|uniref:DUF2975 domain-containing protein n=1 Tax=Streptomyces sp. NPDC001401 TaxID=3364570 RepID=UPI0036CBC38F
MSVESLQVRRGGRLLEVVLGLALALAGIFGVFLPFLGVTGPFDSSRARDVTIEAVTRVPAAVSSGPVTLHGTHRAEIALAHPDVQQRILLALPDLFYGALLILVLALLLRMARTLREGDVFVPENARRLQVIAAAIVAMGVLGPAVDAITTHLLISGTAVSPAVPFAYTVSAAPLLLGLLVAALAEVFRQGTRLREDTEGLV